MTGRFGMGHMTAALAVKQQIEDSDMGAVAEVIDWLDYISPKLAAKYYTFFHFLVDKGHRLYNTRYRSMENKKINQKPEFSAYFLKVSARLIKEKKPDLIISTLPVCSQIISGYKEKTGSYLPLITCVTDITGHSEWINKHTDFYFVGSRSVAEKFIAKGVPSDRIAMTGMPVRLEFLRYAMHNKENRNTDKRKLLIMGGGLGMLPKVQEFYIGLEQLPNTEVTVITGKNHHLFRQLEGKYKNINVLGYVNNVCDLMEQADLIITKPGGITTFEAIFAEVPILAFPPSLQQEIYNAQYILEMRIGAVLLSNSRQWLEDIKDILDSGQLNSYRNNMKELKKHLNYQDFVRILELAAGAGVSAASVKNSGYMAPYHSMGEEYDVNEAIGFNL